VDIIIHYITITTYYLFSYKTYRMKNSDGKVLIAKSLVIKNSIKLKILTTI